MVATRNHPKDFDTSPAPTPPPEPSPRKRTTRTSTTNNTSLTKTSSPPTTPIRARAPRSKSSRAGNGWSHTPSNLTLIWLAVSLPLVLWDTGYVMLRPYSMPGGWAHKPLWVPYALYGTIDHTYGWKAYNANSGWTLAQGSLNALETIAYGVYLYLVYVYGENEEDVQGRGAPDKEDVEEAMPGAMAKLRALSESRTVYGRVAGGAVLLAYTAAQITFWKTVLYWLIEVFSGFDNIGHNDWATLFFMWIVPNGAWLVLPAYMMYVFGGEILQGLDIASNGSAKRQ